MRVQSLGGQGTSVDTYGSPGFYPPPPRAVGTPVRMLRLETHADDIPLVP
jgi:hypothetical protein